MLLRPEFGELPSSPSAPPGSCGVLLRKRVPKMRKVRNIWSNSVFCTILLSWVECPPDSFRDPAAPLVICIVGHDPFRQDLEAELRMRKVEDHPVEVRTRTPGDKLSVCHVVFPGYGEKPNPTRSCGTCRDQDLDGWRNRGVRCAGRHDQPHGRTRTRFILKSTASWQTAPASRLARDSSASPKS